VDLGVNGGSECAVYRNRLSHWSKYAFAGLVVGDPSRSGGEFSDNWVSSSYNMLGFGIVVGCHPWAACKGGYVNDVLVHNNSSTSWAVRFLPTTRPATFFTCRASSAGMWITPLTSARPVGDSPEDLDVGGDLARS